MLLFLGEISKHDFLLAITKISSDLWLVMQQLSSGKMSWEYVLQI